MGRYDDWKPLIRSPFLGCTEANHHSLSACPDIPNALERRSMLLLTNAMAMARSTKSLNTAGPTMAYSKLDLRGICRGDSR